MEFIIGLFFLTYLIYLLYESYMNKVIRSSFKHIIHVNGTRGKSSTSRLIEAALRNEGYKVFCKTTGTSPSTIDVFGVEKEIYRRASPNIKEQIKILRQAREQNADILVIECMAVKPELQHISQRKILNADISIVTNVRMDHLDEMGQTLGEIARSLGNVMPENGYFITAERRFIDYYRKLGKEMKTQVILARDMEEDYGIDFKENVSIALEVCKLIGVEEEAALARMKNYKKDPGVLKTYKLKTEDKDISFINGFAINDPESIFIIYKYLYDKAIFKDKEFILLVNNRNDRAYRVEQHIEIILKLNPDKVWIVGSNKRFMKRKLIEKGIADDKIFMINNYRLKEINYLTKDATIYAIGNIVGLGEKILKYVKEIGEEYV